MTDLEFRDFLSPMAGRWDEEERMQGKGKVARSLTERPTALQIFQVFQHCLL